MSYKVEIIETNNKLEISSSINEQTPSIDIIQETSPSISITHDVALLPSDFSNNTQNIIQSFLQSGYGVSIFPSGDYLLVQTSGLQPSGNYSLNGHNHSSLDITDFGQSVSGLIPVKNIISGSGISVVNNNDIFTVSVTGQFGLTAEQVDDKVNSLLVAGTGISLSYDDSNDRLTISTIGLQPSGNYSIVGHGHSISDISHLQNALDNKAPLVHSHSAEAIVSGTLDFNRLPFTVTYPVRAVHVGGMIAFNNYTYTISPAYYWNGTYGDLHTITTMQFPATSIYIDVSQSVTKYLNDNPGRIFSYASLEVVLIDAANRIVGWGTTASSPAPNPSNGTAGTSMTIPLLSFPSVSNTWVIGGLPTTDTNTVDILPIIPYKKVASRWLDIEKYDWNNVVNPPSTYAPSSHSHGNITNIGTIGTQSNQILITSTSGLITTTSNIPSSQISGLDVNVSGLISGIYAPLHSPSFSGVPTVPTAANGNSSSQIANTQFVRNEISSLVNSAPNTLDTLNELASALGNDPNFATTVASGLGSKASLSGANFIGNVTAPSGDFIFLKQNGIIVSTSGHKHYSNDILDFNAAVSGLLPVKDIISGNNITISNNSGQFTVAVTGQLGLTAEQVDDRVSGLLSAGNYVNLNYSDDNNLLTISVTGLQPSGNYSLFGHGHTINDISNLQNALDQKASLSGANFTNLQVTGVPVSLSGHKHLYNDVIDFASGVADNVTTLLVAGNNINLIYNEQVDTLTISTTGLQPVGNYSIVGHEHTVSDITNFTSGVNSLVSGIYAPLSGNLSQFSTTSSSQLRTVISDETGSGSLVFADNPTLSGVTINGNLTVSGSGLVASNINNFDAQVRTNRLDQMSSPTNNISLNSKNITNLADPINSQDAATKAYVDAARAGLDVKQSVRAASTSSDTSPSILSGFRTIDGVALSEGDRVLMKNTNPATFRGIFVVSSGIWSLATDADTNEKVTAGMFVFVEEGDTNADSGWVLTTNNPITIGTTPLTFAQFSGAGQITAGSGLIKNGNILDVVGSAGRIIVNADNIDLSTVTQSDTISPAAISTVVQDVLRDSYGRITGITTNSIPLATTGIKGIVSFDSENFSVSLGVASIKNSGINNFHLINSSSTIGSTNIVLGSTISSLSGLASVESSLFSGNISSPTGNFLNKLTVNNIDVSVSGHSHTSSNITDFNSSVSGLLPVTNITGNSGIVIGKSGTNYNISSSGLAYLSGATFTGDISANSGIFNKIKLNLGSLENPGISFSNNPGKIYEGSSDAIIISANGNTKAIEIVDGVTVFHDTLVARGGFKIIQGSPSDPSITSDNDLGTGFNFPADMFGSNLGIIDAYSIGNHCFRISNGGNFSIGTTVPSGRFHVSGVSNFSGPIFASSGNFNSNLRVGNVPVSVSGHTHTSSEITDFNSSVSGLLPVKDISAGAYINITNNSGIYTVNSTGEANLLATTVFNKTGSSIPKLSVVYINGGQGDQPTIALASASGEMTSSKTYGITAENINNMSTGKVIVAGALTGVNTDQFNPTAPQGDINGTTLWLSPTVSGGLTTVKPLAPYHMVSVGTVVRTHQNEGIIEVRIQNGFELEELHNVAISGLANNQFIKYDSSTNLWKNVTAIASDISDFNSSVSGLLPVTNILGGTNISIVPSGSVYTVSVSGSLGLTTEEVDDRVSNLLVAGSGINLSYDDTSNSLSIAVSGLSSSSTIGNGVSGVINYDLSQTLNIVGSGSTSIDYNNTSKTVTISSPSLIREYELINDNKSTFTVTGGYSLNNLDVYHNGIKLLASGDYSATNGSTFSLIQPAVSGDVVEWMGYSVVPRHQLILGEVRSDYVGDTNYIGRAVAGSSENDNVWSIKKYVVNSNGIDIITTTASNVSWTNRLSATYV